MISKHISDKESVYSRTAQRLDIDNTPTDDHKDNMVELAENIFEPLRSFVGGPIKINSFYEFIKQNLDFDQIIWEFGNENNPDWVHVSYVSPQQNRNRCLKAYKENNKTKYKIT